jgi:hypothetical protein
VVTEGNRAIAAEDGREVVGGSKAGVEASGGNAVVEGSREITAKAREAMDDTRKKAPSPTCC